MRKLIRYIKQLLLEWQISQDLACYRAERRIRSKRWEPRKFTNE